MVGIEEDSGNEGGEDKNDEGKDDKDDMKDIGDKYGVINGSNIRDKGINRELLDQFNFN